MLKVKLRYILNFTLFYVFCNSENMLDEYGYPNIELMDSKPPKHIWIYYNGKHYDAQEPNGVNNPWDLPIFDEYNWF